MVDDSAQQTKPLKPASRNPWYILATIFGDEEDDELRENNFFIWNCYFSGQFSKEQIDKLNEKHISPGRRGITKLSDQDSRLIIEVFREGRGQGLLLPEPHLPVSFCSTEFPTSFNMGGCIVPGQLNATGSVFRYTASFPWYIENGIVCQESEFFGRATFNGNFNGLADFKRSIFYDMTSFSNANALQWEFKDARFEKRANFHGSIFRSSAEFRNVHFSEELSFRNSLFHCTPNFDDIKGSTLDFSGARFMKRLSLSNIVLHDLLNLKRMNFESDAEFFNIEARTLNAANANFTKNAVLRECTIRESASFEGVLFSGNIDFESSSFFGETNFRKSIFEDQTFFDRAIFSSVASFQSCRFLSQVSFADTCFSKYFPNFKNCIFKENVTFSASHPFWPPVNMRATQESRHSLNTIRHLVGKQGFLDDEHYFFRREMALAARLGTRRQRLPYWLFGLLSDYGNSITRPSWSLFVTWLMGFMVYFWYLFWPENADADAVATLASASKAAGFSFSNLFGFLGFNRLYYSPGDFVALPNTLKIVAASQTVFGTILVFLLGLGLRNRFRLK